MGYPFVSCVAVFFCSFKTGDRFVFIAKGPAGHSQVIPGICIQGIDLYLLLNNSVMPLQTVSACNMRFLFPSRLLHRYPLLPADIALLIWFRCRENLNTRICNNKTPEELPVAMRPDKIPFSFQDLPVKGITFRECRKYP